MGMAKMTPKDMEFRKRYSDKELELMKLITGFSLKAIIEIPSIWERMSDLEVTSTYVTDMLLEEVILLRKEAKERSN